MPTSFMFKANSDDNPDVKRGEMEPFMTLDDKMCIDMGWDIHPTKAYACDAMASWGINCLMWAGSDGEIGAQREDHVTEEMKSWKGTTDITIEMFDAWWKDRGESIRMQVPEEDVPKFKATLRRFLANEWTFQAWYQMR